MSELIKPIDHYRAIKVAFIEWSRGRKARESQIGRVWVWINICAERAKQRRALRDLDAYLLDDIGMTENQRNQEISKRWWQA